MKSPHTEVYQHEMPGGQYSNLQQQAKGVGLSDRWDEVKEMYARVNILFGDLVKVTPSSKVVGDMALFMVQNHLSEQDVLKHGDSLDFPDSVIELFSGQLGQPYGGFPEELQRVILKGQEPITVRPGELLEDVNFEQLKDELDAKLTHPATQFDVLAYALYPKVFLDYETARNTYGDLSVLDTPSFHYGMRVGEEIEVEIERGKTLIIKLISIGEPLADGTRTVYFELNGQAREVSIKDESVKSTAVTKRKSDPSIPGQLGATMPGTVVKVNVQKGDHVKKGDHLMITEAMKMETTVQAPFDGVIKMINVVSGEAVETGDLLLEMEK